MQVSSQVSLRRTFDWKAQDRFAEFSGDRNPMHMDPIAARRTNAHQPVVHGIHLVLWALETLAQRGNLPQSITEIKVRFKKLIYVGEEVTVQIVRKEGAQIHLQLCVDGLPVTSLDVTLGSTGSGRPCQIDRDNMPLSEWPEEPANLPLAELEHSGGALPIEHDVDSSKGNFPALSSIIGPLRVSALGRMSRLVGMVCPGLLSMFFGLNIKAVPTSETVDRIRYQVSSVDESVRLVTQSIDGGGWSGSIASLALRPPVVQRSLADLAGFVDRNEFHKVHALIIGGSRGLGELTAKLIAIGGGSVAITYAVGLASALEVQRQIREWGGECEVLKYDATLPAKEQLTSLGQIPTSLYYFATGTIFIRKTRLYSPTLFQQFHRMYADGFYDLCVSLLREEQAGISVFYPSSVAVDNRPSDLTEYAMAKACGEVLCADLERFDRRFRLVVERLPRMLTDQTATVIQLDSVEPIQVMLPIIRRMEALSPTRV
jgi:hypothetical protein